MLWEMKEGDPCCAAVTIQMGVCSLQNADNCVTHSQIWCAESEDSVFTLFHIGHISVSPSCDLRATGG